MSIEPGPDKIPSVPPAFIVQKVLAFQSGLQNLAEGLAPPFVKILDMATGFMRTQCIVVIAKLEIADHLADGPQSVDSLSQETETDPDSLYRLLRVCASLGVFRETSSQRHSLSLYTS